MNNQIDEETLNTPGKCPKCGSDNLESLDYEDGDVECDTEWGENNSIITYSYYPFLCNACGCKGTEVYINKYSHTEIDEEK